MQAATRIGIHHIFFYEAYLYLISKSFQKLSLLEPLFLLKHRAIVHRTPSQMFSWKFFEIPTPKSLENIQKNVFSGVQIPDWKFLCRCLSGSAQKRKDIPRFRNFPEAFANVCLFLLRYRLAKQNSLLQQKQTPTKLFPVSFVRKQSKWRHFIKVVGLPLRFYKLLKGTRHTKCPEERL